MKATSGKRWFKHELELLRIIRRYMPTKRISEVLGRTPRAISQKLWEIDNGKIKL